MWREGGNVHRMWRRILKGREVGNSGGEVVEERKCRVDGMCEGGDGAGDGKTRES